MTVQARLLQDELDRISDMWDGHRIRRNKQDHVSHGRPLVMFEIPHIYGTRDYMCHVDHRRIDIVKLECSFKASSPCDPNLFEYCCQLMADNGYTVPEDPEEATHLYINLRRHVRRILGYR